jgi:hypothetical protein
MLCESCAAVSYSAAARQIVTGGAACPRCGGRLELELHEPVGAGASSDAPKRPVRERSES